MQTKLKTQLKTGGLLLAAGFCAVDLTAQTTSAPQPANICNRACWSARAPQCSITMQSAGSITHAVIHHTASATTWNTTSQSASASYLRGHQNYHMDVQGWCDLAYNFTVDKLGNIFEGRYGSLSGLPRGGGDVFNTGAQHFTFMGNCHAPNNQAPPTIMRTRIYDTVAWKMPSGWTPYGSATYSSAGTQPRLHGHRSTTSTSCPGDLVQQYIGSNLNAGEMRTSVAARRTPGSTGAAGICDFDGDGKTDYSIYRPSDGSWLWKPSGGGANGAYSWGLAGDIPMPGDYDGDGKTDYTIYRPSDGSWRWKPSGGGANVAYGWGASGDIPVRGDFDGDGKNDYAIYRPSDGNWLWKPSGGGANGAYGWGVAGDIPVPGDYDGDGKTDYAVYRPSNGSWVWKPSSGAANVAYGWGLSGDIPVPGDYDGDGKNDYAVYRPSDGSWVWKPSSGAANVAYGWGMTGDIPMPGDYDGDGKNDYAIYRPSNGSWLWKPSGGGANVSYGWGAAGDIALPLPYAIRKVFFP